ncbi:MAG: hypothetical protein P1P78_10075 [Methyloprofundus sp.]|nr:hypothetical protein [Methyloprofundus sp.]
MEHKTEKRGRKSLPLDKKKPPQATVKINDFILPFVQELKGYLRNNLVTEKTLVQLFDVLKGKSDQQSSAFNDPDSVSIVTELQEKIHTLDAEKRLIERALAKQQEISLKLTQERDKAHLNAVHTESRLESLKSSYRLLKYDYDVLMHREHDCMAIKCDGERCTRPATLEKIEQSIVLRVCHQHAKIAEKYS